MATLLSYIKVKEGQEGAYEDMQATLYDETHAREPGCRRYEFFRQSEIFVAFVSSSFQESNLEPML